MLANDQTAHALGMVLMAVGAGSATLTMPVQTTMSNGVGTAHGGYIFTLADTAFAYACNSSNTYAVATDCSIQFLRPAYAGMVLKATATQTALKGKTGIYDVLVSNVANEEIIATFRGKSTQIKGTHLAE